MPLFAGLHGDRRLISPAVRRTRLLPFPLRSLSEAPPPRAFFLPVHPLTSTDAAAVRSRRVYLGRARCEGGCSSWEAWIQRRRPRLQRNQETLKRVRLFRAQEVRLDGVSSAGCLFVPVGSASWRRPAFSVFCLTGAAGVYEHKGLNISAPLAPSRIPSIF